MGDDMGKGKRVKEQRQAVRADRQEAIRRASVDQAPIIIKCPSTGKFIRTGFMADPHGFATGTYQNNTTPCPHCGRNHRWGDAEMALDN